MRQERLGERMVAAGKMDGEQLKRALAFQAVTGGRLGEILVDLGFVTLHDVLGAVVEQRAAHLDTGRLGDILVGQGVINRVLIGKAVALQKRDVRRRRLLGEVLLDEGMITRAQLFEALEEQLYQRSLQSSSQHDS